MPRYALKIEYHGGPFAGWQRQRDQPSVQGAVEAALQRLDPDCGPIAAAGRTDAGVHAWGQVAHADLKRDWDPFRLAAALNHHLKPAPVAVLAAARVADGWHARFSARSRSYRYAILNRPVRSALQRHRVWWVRQPLDHAPGVVLNVAVARGRRGQEVARPCIVPRGEEGIANDARGFAGNENLHLHQPRFRAWRASRCSRSRNFG